MRLSTKIILCLIIVLAFFLRVYKLDSIPPSLSWDEAAAGYNGWTIANYGRDEWGVFFPLVFRSFDVDANPVWIYATAISTKLLGLSDFSTRFPAALFGVFDVVLLFYLATLLFDNELFGLFAALSLAVSPYNLQFSRGEWEANYALFFFLSGLYFFIKSMKQKNLPLVQKNFYLVFSLASFGIDLFTYPAAKILTPLMLVILFLVYAKDLLKNIKGTLLAVGIFALFALAIVLNPRLFGGARASQSKIPQSQIEATQLFKETKNNTLGFVQAAWEQYKLVLSPQFLFISGDKNPKLSVQKVGEFYYFDIPFLILGIIFLLKKRSKITLILLFWMIFAPIPSAIAADAPHAHRSMFLMGSFQLLIALGVGEILLLIRKVNIRVLAALLYMVGFGYFCFGYLNYYYTLYPKDRAIDWQYGYRQVVEYVKNHPEYNQVYMTNVRAQPYIFFLYYLQIPLKDFRDTVIYNTHGSEGESLVDSFGKFHFNDWDPINCQPVSGTLCIVSPSEYGGLRALHDLKIKQLVKYPSGDPAFYIVSVN